MNLYFLLALAVGVAAAAFALYRSPFFGWMARVMSEPTGPASATRFLMLYGAGVTSGLLAAMLWVLRESPALLAPIFGNALQYFITATVLGYTVNKAAGAYVAGKGAPAAEMQDGAQ